MDTKEIVFVIIGLILSSFTLGHFLWPRTVEKTFNVPVLAEGEVKKCLDKGGTFFAERVHNVGQSRCRYPSSEDYTNFNVTTP